MANFAKSYQLARTYLHSKSRLVGEQEIRSRSRAAARGAMPMLKPRPVATYKDKLLYHTIFRAME
jgi:hypothetical protein